VVSSSKLADGPSGHADAYEAMLKPELLPEIGNAKGYRGSYLLPREAGTEIEFITVLLWDSVEAIRAIAGPNYETAVVPEERRSTLLGTILRQHTTRLLPRTD
jgi:hypothetical protein